MRNFNRPFLNPEQTDFDEVMFQAIDEEYQDEGKFERVDPQSIAIDRQTKAYAQQHNVSYAEALTALGHTF